MFINKHATNKRNKHLNINVSFFIPLFCQFMLNKSSHFPEISQHFKKLDQQQMNFRAR